MSNWRGRPFGIGRLPEKFLAIITFLHYRPCDEQLQVLYCSIRYISTGKTSRPSTAAASTCSRCLSRLLQLPKRGNHCSVENPLFFSLVAPYLCYEHFKQIP